MSGELSARIAAPSRVQTHGNGNDPRQAAMGLFFGYQAAEPFTLQERITVWYMSGTLTGDIIPANNQARIWDTDQATTDAANVVALNNLTTFYKLFTIPGSLQLYAAAQQDYPAIVAAFSVIPLWDLFGRTWRRSQLRTLILANLISLLSGTSLGISIFLDSLYRGQSQNIGDGSLTGKNDGVTLTGQELYNEATYDCGDLSGVTNPYVEPFAGSHTYYQTGLGYAKGLTANRLARNSSGVTVAIDDAGKLWSFSPADMSGTVTDITSTLNLSGMLLSSTYTLALAIACDGTNWWCLMQQSNGGGVEWGTYVLKSADLSTWTITQTVQNGIGATSGVIYGGGYLQLNYDSNGDVSGIACSGPVFLHFADGTTVALDGLSVGPPTSGSFDIYGNEVGTLSYGSGDILVWSCTIAMPTAWGRVGSAGLDSGTPPGQPCTVGLTVSVPADVAGTGGNIGHQGMDIDLGSSPFYVQTDGLSTLTLPAVTSYWVGWLYAYHHNDEGGDTYGDTHLLCGPLFLVDVADATSSQSFTAVNASQIEWDIAFLVNPDFVVTESGTSVEMDRVATLGIGNEGAILYGTAQEVGGYGELANSGWFRVAWTYATDAGDQFTLSDADSLLLSGAFGMAGNQSGSFYIPAAFGGSPSGIAPPVIGTSGNFYFTSDPPDFSTSTSAVPAILWPDGTVDTAQAWAGACVDGSGNKYAVESASGNLYLNGSVMTDSVIEAGDMVALLAVSRQQPGKLLCIHGQSYAMIITYVTIADGTLLSGSAFTFPTNEYFSTEFTTDGDFSIGAFTVAAEQ